MVILQYCSDKQESARKCDSKLYWKSGSGIGAFFMGEIMNLLYDKFLDYKKRRRIAYQHRQLSQISNLRLLH